MYCKKCGKQIDDDAQFCKFCGENVGANPSPSTRRGLVEWFQSKSRTRRLIIILGLIWLFIGICFLFVCEYTDDYLMVFAVFIGTPLIVWSAWYYFKYLRKERKHPRIFNYSIDEQQDTTASLNHKKPEFIPLLDFAKEYGDMQVSKIADGKTGEIKSRCVFTKRTFVDFPAELGELSASEISDRKDCLFVKIIDEEKFVLVNKE